MHQLSGLALPSLVWERGALPARLARYAHDLDALDGELVWAGEARGQTRLFFRGAEGDQGQARGVDPQLHRHLAQGPATAALTTASTPSAVTPARPRAAPAAATSSSPSPGNAAPAGMRPATRLALVTVAPAPPRPQQAGRAWRRPTRGPPPAPRPRRCGRRRRPRRPRCARPATAA